MGDDTAPNAGGNPLLHLSLRTKALVIANEYTHRQMEPNELARVLVALAPEPEERAQVTRAVEEELRAARYPLNEIVRLMGELISIVDDPQDDLQDEPEPAAPPALESHPTVAPANEQVIITRKVRAPHLMPFERYEFQAPEVETAEPPEVGETPDGAAPGPPPPTRRMPVDEVMDEAARLKAMAEAPAPASPAAPQSAGFSIDRFKELGRAKPEADRARPVVLVADDDARARVMYRMKLEQSGFAVMEAKDGVDAWDQIKSGAIEYLVTDMKMPGYHGLEILGRMVDAGMTIPVVVVSAFDQLENEYVVSTYPRLKFLAKPASPESVAAAVAAFVRESRN